MIISEKDAAAVWCPHSNGMQHLDPFRDGGKTNCLGARCGAWRWVDRDRGYCGMAGPAQERPAETPDPIAADADVRVARQTTRGGAARTRG